jgi:hypothetical protein
LFLSKGHRFEIGNWNGMQPLHKMYGLITYFKSIHNLKGVKFFKF